MRIKNLGKILRMGIEIEKALKETGLKGCEDSIENYFRSCTADKEQMKQRISELISAQKVLSIKKLAEILNINVGESENFIYELVADGIEGALEEGVFKFTNTQEEVISKLFELIDKM